MLEFDPESHIYTLDGLEVPSVTRVLDDMGLMPSYPEKAFYRKRGSAVHKACALMASGKLALEDTDDRLHGYIESFRKFLSRTGFRAELIEHPVSSSIWRVAGTLDYWGKLDGVSTIIDLKSGEPADAAALQTAGYADMLNYSERKQTARRMCLKLSPDGHEPTIQEYTYMSHDLQMFLSAVSLWHWRKSKGLIR